MKATYWLVLLLLAWFVGCSSEQDTATPETASAPPLTTQSLVPGINPDLGAPVAAAPQPSANAGSGAPAAATEQTPSSAAPLELTPPALNPPTQAAQPAANPAMEQVKAEAGVGIKGRSLDQYEGVIVTPAKTLFTVRERVVFEIQIPEALKLYKATNGNGPKSHEDFMTQIIEANNINLPELPAGQRYVYDPAKEELMVERPK